MAKQSNNAANGNNNGNAAGNAPSVPQAATQAATGNAGVSVPLSPTTPAQTPPPAIKQSGPFGLGLGTNNAKVAGVLTATPQRMAAIMAQAGVTRSYYNLLNGLWRAGKIGKSPAGFYLLPPTNPNP